MPAGAQVRQRLPLAQPHRLVRPQAEGLQLEHLGGQAAMGLAVEKLQVDQQLLGLVAVAEQLETHLDLAADGDLPGADAHLAQRHLGPLAMAHQPQGVWVALLEGHTQGMPHDPLPLGAAALPPALGRLQHQGGVVLADVVEVVGHRAAHVQRRVVLQPLQQGKHRAGITLEGAQARGPGQARAAAFGHQAAHMLAGVVGPFSEPRQGGFGVVFQKRPDAEFGREPLGQCVLKLHRQLEVPQPVGGDDHAVRQPQERRRDSLLPEGVQEDGPSLGKVTRQVTVHGLGQVAGAGHEFQRLQTEQRVLGEALGGKGRVGGLQHLGNLPHHRRAEEVFQGLGHRGASGCKGCTAYRRQARPCRAPAGAATDWRPQRRWYDGARAYTGVGMPS